MSGSRDDGARDDGRRHDDARDGGTRRDDARDHEPRDDGSREEVERGATAFPARRAPFDVARKLTVVVRCDVDPHEVECAYDATSRARLDDLRDEKGALVEQRQREGRPFQADERGELLPLHRLVAAALDERGRLALRTGLTDYAEFVLTNVARPARRSERGDASMSDALGVCAALVTSDERVLLGRRAARLDDRPGALHVVPAGHPHPPDAPWAGLLAELDEELGIAPGEVVAARCTGVLRALPTGKPELVYALRVRLDAASILARSRVDAWEHAAIDARAWNERDVRALLVDERDDLTSPAHGCLLLAGARDFGEAWLREIDAATSGA